MTLNSLKEAEGYKKAKAFISKENAVELASKFLQLTRQVPKSKWAKSQDTEQLTITNEASEGWKLLNAGLKYHHTSSVNAKLSRIKGGKSLGKTSSRSLRAVNFMFSLKLKDYFNKHFVIIYIKKDNKFKI